MRGRVNDWCRASDVTLTGGSVATRACGLVETPPMPMSPYVARIRERIGHDLLLLPCAAAAVIRDGRLLLARHVDGGLWSMVGGSVDPDESPADAALRELSEETGLIGEAIGIVGCYGGPANRLTYQNGDVISFVSTVYACRLVGGTPSLEAGEIAEIGWFVQQDAMALARQPWTDSVLPDVFGWIDNHH
jgi:8-oxo-dGTP diphosphatase